MKPGFPSPVERKDGGGDGEASGADRGGAAFDAAAAARRSEEHKSPFRITQDDSKPLLRDPILRSDPIETEQAVLRLPPFPRSNV